MGCVASLPPAYDISIHDCNNPYHCAIARFLEHELDDDDTVEIKIKKKGDKRSYRVGNLTVTELLSTGFREFRQQEGITEAEFFDSLVGEQARPLPSNSKGSSYFSRTHDLRYVVKEIKAPEIAHMQKMAADLFEHWERNPNSLLNRIYAAFTISDRSGPRHFVVIKNSFPHEFSLLKSEYDLKGAKGGNRKRKKDDRTGKDLDFDANYPQGLTMSPSKTSQFAAALESDTTFLKRWNCIDYSLLVSVYKDDVTSAVGGEGAIDCVGIGRARFCIIDYLREFDLAKRRESTVKNMFRSDASVQNPHFYKQRFMREITPSSFSEEINTVSTTQGEDLAVSEVDIDMPALS